jgi:hypothetical protein
MTEISLRGLLEVASDILAGIFREVAFAFTEAEEEDWDVYDIESG